MPPCVFLGVFRDADLERYLHNFFGGCAVGRALMAAAQRAEERVLETFRRFGKETDLAAIRQDQDETTEWAMSGTPSTWN